MTPIGVIVTPIGMARVLVTGKADSLIFGCFCLLIGAAGLLAFDYIGGITLQVSNCQLAFLAK